MSRFVKPSANPVICSCGACGKLYATINTFNLCVRYNRRFPAEPGLAGFIGAKDDCGGEW